MNEHKERIELHDDFKAVLLKMGEGNPGALNTVASLLQENADDPDCALGSLGAVLSLDTFGVYGSRIWMLYGDVCGRNVTRMRAILRACQLGILPQAKLNHAIDNYGAGIAWDELLTAVGERLPNFRIDGAALDAADHEVSTQPIAQTEGGAT